MPTGSQIEPGHCRQLGATLDSRGVNFAIWGRYAKTMELLLFAHESDTEPRCLVLTAPRHRSGYYWHIHVAGIEAGQIYGWRVKTPLLTLPANCFSPNKVLLDPYGRRILLPKQYRREAAMESEACFAECAKSVVVDLDGYDWEGDRFPRHPLPGSVIYEMHVAGFTRSPSSGLAPKKRGTYAGVIDKIPYLQELGVTAVELLPIFQFDPQDARTGLSNYWGYSPMGFFAPHAEYSSDDSLLGVLDEFRDMVKALHRANIEVILDVVYNHTAEGGDNGPSFCFRGLDNEAFYILDESQQRNTNYSGCGNTLNASHPMTKKLITDSLRFWREEMHVDGFRFDLASILSRDKSGTPLTDPPTLLAIDSDYSLADTKLFAEAWDAGGLYQVGSLAGLRWREWNGQFRDDIRRFIRGDNGMVPRLASRLIGSPDIYHPHYNDPQKSVNFVTCHDGFTLWDLLSFNHKHNLANGEDNQDGSNDNYSWDHGMEGETCDPEILSLRMRQAKNLALLTLLSVGTPMLLMGDERLRSQQGNNNAYCQDNSLSWLDWSRSSRGEEMQRFMSELIRYRTARPRPAQGIVSLAETLESAGIVWHGVQPHAPDWSDHSHSLGMTGYAAASRTDFYAFFNSYWEPQSLTLPTPPHNPKGQWLRVIDTGLAPPLDITPLGLPLPPVQSPYLLAPRATLILFCRRNNNGAPHEEPAGSALIEPE